MGILGNASSHANNLLEGFTSEYDDVNTPSRVRNISGRIDTLEGGSGVQLEGLSDLSVKAVNLVDVVGKEADPYDIASGSLDLISAAAQIGGTLGPKAEMGALFVSTLCSFVTAIIGASKPKKPSAMEIMEKNLKSHIDRAFADLKFEKKMETGKGEIEVMLRQAPRLRSLVSPNAEFGPVETSMVTNAIAQLDNCARAVEEIKIYKETQQPTVKLPRNEATIRQRFVANRSIS